VVTKFLTILMGLNDNSQLKLMLKLFIRVYCKYKNLSQICENCVVRVVSLETKNNIRFWWDDVS